MVITEIEHIKQLPTVTLRGYSLGTHYGEKEAKEDFVALYGVEPAAGWRWGEYVYFELPVRPSPLTPLP